MHTRIVAGGLLGLAALAGPALADARDDVLTGAARCASILDPRLWLDCYYGAAQPMRAQLGLPPAPASQTRLVDTAPPLPAKPASAAMAAPPPRESSNGFREEILGGKTVVTKMPMVSYKLDKSGLFTFTLQNGEVWQQVPGDGIFAHWSGPASLYLVTIKDGMFGSHNLEVQSDKARYKVRRIN